MKKLLVVASSVLLLGLAGCGSADTASKKIDDHSTKAAAKTGNQQSKSASTNNSSTSSNSTTSQTKSSDDPWTYYNNATWSDNFNGLKLQVEKVVVTDKAPEEADTSKKDASAVGVRFKMENTTKDKFTIYPDQASLVTSTGEQIDAPSMLATDHLGGEIDLGVIKEGNIIWYLQRGHAADIKWVKLKFSGHVGGEDQLDGQSKDFEFTINLK